MNNNGSLSANQTEYAPVEHEHVENAFEVSVLLFASLKDALGTDHIQVRLPIKSGQSVTVADFLTQCGQQHPALAAWLPHVQVAINLTYADSHQTLKAGDEVALLPPVSGGC